MTQLDQRASMRRMQLARTAWAKLRAQAGRGPVEPVETEEEPQNPETYRAMDLVLRVGELLLASGEATETVSEAMRSLAVAYGLPRSEAAVTFTAISLSCLPGHGAAPITGERVVRRRSPDHSRLVDTHQLVGDAALGMVELDEAFTRLHAIKHGPSRYPRWLTALSLPLLAAFAAVLFGGGPVIAVIALVATWAGERATTVLARRGVAEFYQFAATAMIAPATGLALVWTGLAATPSAVVSGALMALLPGRPLVASVQDGISGAFVSSGARLLEVFFIGAAIVSGAGMTMYLAARLGVTGRLDALPVFEAGLEPGQIVGAAGIAVT
ncbi:MAG: threonine/serine exporter family protein, partial [Micromonosporaceae bacterium]